MPCLFCGNLEAPGVFKPHHPCHLSDGEPCAPCKEVQELEPLIAQAKDALHKMLARHRELRRKMNHSHNPIIQQLPPEIVSHIFELSIPNRPLEESSRGLSKNEIRAPLILGSVCQVWRQIAFSTPQIWTTISLYLPHRLKSAKTMPTHCKLAQEWISRSGKLPLSIYVYGNGDTDETANKSLIKIVNRHSSRWKHLELELPYHLASLLRGNASGISVLQSLRLHRDGQSQHRTDSAAFTLDNVKPSPGFVHLDDWPLNRVNIDWNCASSLTLGCPVITECIEVLVRAPKLKSFKFTNTEDGRYGDDAFLSYAVPTAPIVRLLLQELYIGVQSANYAVKFLDIFILPGLKNLTLSFFLGTAPTETLISLLNRSSCVLTTLSINQSSIDTAEILPLLRATTSVRNLNFSGLSDTGFLDALETLTILFMDETDPDGHLLPALELFSLGVKLGSKDPLPWTRLSKTLTGISSLHRRPLPKFDLYFIWYHDHYSFESQYMDEESIHHFLKLREAGVALHFGINHNQYFDRYSESHIEELDLLQLSIEHHSKSNKFPDSSC